MSSELVMAMKVLEEEKGITADVIKEALEQALVLAYKKNYDQAQNVEVKFDTENGAIKVYSVKEVVEAVEDATLEVSLSEAWEKNRAYELGDMIRYEVTPENFGRLATQTAKHVILQRLREAERDIVYDEFIDYEDEILSGTVERLGNGIVFVNLGRAEAVMPPREQIPGESFEMDQRINVYVAKVEKTSRGPQIIVSRSHSDFLKRLFEKEIPEVYDGIVEVMSIAREAGDRAKVAVRSRDSQIDPVGTCVGQGGQRVNRIVDELNGENMDIIEYSDDPKKFIENAMKPAQVLEVVFDEEEDNSCIVVVPEYQLSLAIGKKGQNARLAARLTGYRIDIKSEEDYASYLHEREAQIQAQVEAQDSESLEADPEELSVLQGEGWDSGDELDPPAQTYVDQQIQEADQAEGNFDPEGYEATMAEAEISLEQDYEDLVEDQAIQDELAEKD